MNAKMWAAAVGIAAITTIGGGVWLNQTVAQSPAGGTPPAASAEPAPSAPPDPKPGVYQQPLIRFRIEYLTVKRESTDQAAFAEQLRKYGRDGWHFDASEMLVPTSGGDAVPHLVFSRQTPDLGVAGYYVLPPGVPPKQRADVPSPPPTSPPSGPSDRSSMDGLTTSVVVVRHANAAELAQLVKPLVGGDGRTSVTVEPVSNTLLLATTPPNAERLRTLIARLDLPAAQTTLIRLKNVSATEAATSLREVFFGPKGKAPLTTPTGRMTSMVIAADERTNAIIVSGSAKDIGVVEKLVATIDQAQPAGTKTVTIPLKHISATAAVETVRAVYAVAKEGAFRVPPNAPAERSGR